MRGLRQLKLQMRSSSDSNSNNPPSLLVHLVVETLLVHLQVAPTRLGPHRGFCAQVEHVVMNYP